MKLKIIVLLGYPDAKMATSSFCALSLLMLNREATKQETGTSIFIFLGVSNRWFNIVSQGETLDLSSPPNNITCTGQKEKNSKCCEKKAKPFFYYIFVEGHFL